MSPKTAGNERVNLRSQVNFLRVLGILLVVGFIVQSVIIGYVVFREKTLVVPPEVRRPYEIGADFANRDYLQDIATYVLDKVLTVTPEQVDYNNRVIMKMTHPDGAAALRTSLDSAAMRIKSDKISTVWIPRVEKISEQEKRVEVSGKLKTYIADKLVSEKDKTYVVEFTVTSSGRLYVTVIREVEKRETASRPASSD